MIGSQHVLIIGFVWLVFFGGRRKDGAIDLF
jgi:hypothetical protein